MAITDYTDFVIDNQYFHTGLFEGLTQNLGLFNEVSGGAVRLIDNRLPGHLSDRLLYKTLEDSWNRRDITAASAISSADTAQVQEISQRGVKLNAKMYAPFILHAFQKNFDPSMKGDYQQISRRIGQATAPARLKQQVNHSLYAARSALTKSSAASKHAIVVSSANYNGKMNSVDLNTARALMGDMAGRLKCMVMHSKPYFDLVGNQVADKLTGVSDLILREGSGLTYNTPVLVIDSPALYATIGSGSAAYTEYYTLLLTEDAVVVQNSEAEAMVAEVVTGKENLQIDLQGEGAHNVEVRGFAWAAGGGINPTDAALATASNWDLASASIKNRAGVAIASR